MIDEQASTQPSPDPSRPSKPVRPWDPAESFGLRQPPQPPQPPQPARAARSTQPGKPRSFLRELPILLLVAVVVAVVVRAFLLQTFYIPSESMENTLLINDRVLVNKLVYDFRDPHRGEIIVFKSPWEWRTDPTEEDFIKRVIAVGGDHVVCCDAQGRITVNGYPLEEPYLYTDATGNQDPPSLDEFDVVVPAGRLWVMGDHRSRSGDSRWQYRRTEGDVMMSTIDVDSVEGRAFVLFWPLSHEDWLSVPDTFSHVPDPPASGS